jgi:hypothetical protein
LALFLGDFWAIFGRFLAFFLALFWPFFWQIFGRFCEPFFKTDFWLLHRHLAGFKGRHGLPFKKITDKFQHDRHLLIGGEID